MTTYSRSDWGARSANGGPGALDSSRVEGVAFHWPAMAKPVRGFNAVSSALRGWQNFHMDGRGWSDIAYQVAVDQDGNRYELRGLATQSGANGDSDVNGRFGAVLLVLAPGEKPTTEMVAEARAVVADFRKLHPNGKRIVGHGDIRPGGSECPGPAAQALIDNGDLEPVARRRVTRGKNLDVAIRRTRRERRQAEHPRRKRILRTALEWLRKINPRKVTR